MGFIKKTELENAGKADVFAEEHFFLVRRPALSIGRKKLLTVVKPAALAASGVFATRLKGAISKAF